MKLLEPLVEQPQVHLDEVLTLLVNRVATLLGAERCTLFLHDADRGDLVSRVRTGRGRLELRVSASSGLAGACYTRGVPVNVADAYSDPRFNPEIDARTGIRTRCALCYPIFDGDGTTMGVIQVINKNEGAFTSSDLEVLRGFCDQASLILRNAREEDAMEQTMARERELTAELTARHSRLEAEFQELNRRHSQLQETLARTRMFGRASWALAALLAVVTLVKLVR